MIRWFKKRSKKTVWTIITFKDKEGTDLGYSEFPFKFTDTQFNINLRFPIGTAYVHCFQEVREL